MAGQDDRPPSYASWSKSRLEGFSDGVFSIAITLLVLDIALTPPGSALHQVLGAWPSYLAYVISFFTIGAAWLGHHSLTQALARVDPILLRLNLLLLLVVGFLPFPTRLVAEALQDVEGERVYVTMYGLTLLAIRLFGYALDEYARREHLYASEGDAKETGESQGSLWGVLVGYVLAVLIGVALPRLAVAIYAAIAAYLVVPVGHMGRLLFRRS